MPNPGIVALDHRARVLALNTIEEARRAIEKVGPVPSDQDWLVGETTHWAIRLEDVAGRAVSILQTHMAAANGECVIPASARDSRGRPHPVILVGNPRQYRQVIEKLRMQPYGLSAIAQELSDLLDCYESAPPPLQLPSGELNFDQGTLVIGIVNMTPDSFSGDGLSSDPRAAVAQARQFAAGGADIIDIGGQSTRPGSEQISIEQELQRIIPALQAIRTEVDVPISVDTRQAQVASVAIEEGAELINDVYGLRGQGMLEIAAQTGVPVVIMHMQGTPETMQDNPTYQDLITDIYGFFAQRIEAAVNAGIAVEQIIVDPGFGFGKTVDHNLEILRRLREFRSLGRPVLIGTSRKSTIGEVLDRLADQRLWGTAATCAVAIANGANIIRVHDVAEMIQVAKMTDAIIEGFDCNASS